MNSSSPGRAVVALARVAVVLGGLVVGLLPARASAAPSLAVLELGADGRDQPMAELVTQDLVAQARKLGLFEKVLSPQDITLRLGDTQHQQLTRCAADRCTLVDEELTAMLGVTHLVVGNLWVTDGVYSVSARLLELRRALEVSSASAHRVGLDPAAVSELTRPMLAELITRAELLKDASPASRAAVLGLTAPVRKASGKGGGGLSRVVGGIGAGVGVLGVVGALAMVAGMVAALGLWAPIVPNFLIAFGGDAPLLVKSGTSTYRFLLLGGLGLGAAAGVGIIPCLVLVLAGAVWAGLGFALGRGGGE
ncbi:MAG: hypothetical protein AB2A00_25560 [Myxococcota bacterium]